jgi:hypothetical protein
MPTLPVKAWSFISPCNCFVIWLASVNATRRVRHTITNCVIQPQAKICWAATIQPSYLQLHLISTNLGFFLLSTPISFHIGNSLSTPRTLPSSSHHNNNSPFSRKCHQPMEMKGRLNWASPRLRPLWVCRNFTIGSRISFSGFMIVKGNLSPHEGRVRENHAGHEKCVAIYSSAICVDIALLFSYSISTHVSHRSPLYPVILRLVYQVFQLTSPQNQLPQLPLQAPTINQWPLIAKPRRLSNKKWHSEEEKLVRDVSASSSHVLYHVTSVSSKPQKKGQGKKTKMEGCNRDG